MADYGVPAELDGALPWEWAQERLVANRNYWFVTSSAAGRPHAMPLWGVWLADTDRFWCSCSTKARKLRNLVENPQCVVTVDDTVECVSVEGRARIADANVETDAVDAVVRAYLAKYWDDADDHAEMADFLRGNALIEVVPDRAFGVIEREDDFGPRATRWRW